MFTRRTILVRTVIDLLTHLCFCQHSSLLELDSLYLDSLDSCHPSHVMIIDGHEIGGLLGYRECEGDMNGPHYRVNQLTALCLQTWCAKNQQA